MHGSRAGWPDAQEGGRSEPAGRHAQPPHCGAGCAQLAVHADPRRTHTLTHSHVCAAEQRSPALRRDPRPVEGMGPKQQAQPPKAGKKGEKRTPKAAGKAAVAPAAAPAPAPAPVPAAKHAAPAGAHADKAKAVKKARTAQKAQQRGTHSTIKRKIRTSPTFRRPKTLRLPRTPKYPRRSAPRQLKKDEFRVVRCPVVSESAMKKIEQENTLVFIVDKRANKHQIKQAVKRLYKIDAAKVNTLIRPDGLKKAYVRLSPDQEAIDVANKMGII